MQSTTMIYLKRVLAILLFTFSCSALSAQEVCNNGVDDDGDGLIDLNDSAACNCTEAPSSVPSLIPNPSFEAYTCCPSTYSQLNCATGWVQASDATSDYMNTCGFMFTSATAIGIAPPDGAGMAGAIVSDGYVEYIGACLTSPMVAGTSYSIQMQVSSYPIDGSGGPCGTITYPAIPIVIYGAPTCTPLPFSGYGCPPSPWTVLGSVTYTPSPTWNVVTITFTPTANMAAIIIGAPCTLPAGYSGAMCYPYFYYDNLLVNTTASFTTSLTQTGAWCTNNIQLSGTAVAGATYQWYYEGVAVVGQTALTLNVSANGLPAGTYNLVTTSGTACSVASIEVVAEGATPPVISPAGPLCSTGPSVTLTADIAGGTWSGDAITGTSTGIFTPTSGVVGNNQVIYTTSGVCPASDTINIVIEPAATVNAGPDQLVCIGNSATMAAVVGGGASSGTWSGGSGTFSLATDPNATYTPSGAEEAVGSVTLTFTTNDPAGACGPVSDNVVLTISPPPAANAGLDQTICAGSGTTLSGSISGAASSATWSGGSGTFTPGPGTLNATYTPSAAEIATGSVTLTLTTNDPPGLCLPGSDDMTITINPIAVVNAGADISLCIGETATLSGTIGGSAGSGTWTGGSGSFSPDAATPNAVYTPTPAEAAAGTVTLTFTTNDPVGPCPAVSDAVVITVIPMPTVNAGPSQTVCSGTTITLAGTVGTGATSGTWSGGTGTYSPSNTALNAVYTPSAAEYAAGSVTLTLTTNDPAGPCPAVTSTVTHSFYSRPEVFFTVDDANGCPAHCVTFADISTVTGATITSWLWSFGDGGTAAVAAPTHCYAASGFYDVTLTVTSSQGCSTTATQNDMIHVFDLPVADFTHFPIPATVLEPTVNFTDQSSADAISWTWYFGDGDSLSGTENPQHDFPGAEPGTYDVWLVVENANGCIDSVMHQIVVGPEFTFFIPNAFTPNNDGINDTFFGTGIGIAEYEMLVFDRWGNLVYLADDLGDKWTGQMSGAGTLVQEDVYVWKVKLKDVFGKKHTYIGTVTVVR